jgi:hypothetical protein
MIMRNNSMSAPPKSFRHAYLEEIFNRMEAGDHSIEAKARSVITLWRQQRGMDKSHCETWEKLLAQSVADMRAAALSDTALGETLRHTFPFAGILTNRERMALRRQYPGLTH